VILEYDETNPNSKLDRIRLQILSGIEANKILLETIIDPATCVATTTTQQQ